MYPDNSASYKSCLKAMKSAVQLSYLAVFAFVASARDDVGHFRDGSSSQEDTCAVSIANHAVQQ